MQVAAYCRVSTDKTDQANSFASQQSFFFNYINHHPDWTLYRIYADEGVTGTSTAKRAGFQHMIDDALTGKFQLILTKEISRFARNTLDSIYYTRVLRQHGVGVRFLNDRIDTLRDDSELFLTIKATLAQEESRTTSARVKWGQTRRMEQGVVFGRSLLGYDVEGGKIRVNAQGAALVRRIFAAYLERGMGVSAIAQMLDQEGIPTYTGRGRWRGATILKILRNEKYCGDLMQKKTYTPDYLSHQKKTNYGQEPKIYLRGHHEPIVDRPMWDAVQAELSQRRNSKKKNGIAIPHPQLYNKAK